uniref:Uncharacterized protein n=1 Tax=Rhizophagus irregularis (strain DAOM 181602 / DAOM 197198 / MUCL 43194) TaxID=747089 RepID=U9T5B7_RHIID
MRNDDAMSDITITKISDNRTTPPFRPTTFADKFKTIEIYEHFQDIVTSHIISVMYYTSFPVKECKTFLEKYGEVKWNPN